MGSAARMTGVLLLLLNALDQAVLVTRRKSFLAFCLTHNFKPVVLCNFPNISAVQTCENRDLKMLENYGLKAHSLDPVPIGGVVNVKVLER